MDDTTHHEASSLDSVPLNQFTYRGSGVYALRPVGAHGWYVGQSRTVLYRVGCHVRALENRRHHSRALQAAFDNSGGLVEVALLASTSDRSLRLRIERSYVRRVGSLNGRSYGTRS